MLEVLCQHAKFGGAQTSHATKGAKNVKFLFVCWLFIKLWSTLPVSVAAILGGPGVKGPPLS